MRLSNFPVVLLLITRACQGGIVSATPSLDNSEANIVEVLVNLVKSCYDHPITAVGLAGNLPDRLSRTLSAHLIPVVLIDTDEKFRPLQQTDIPPVQFWKPLPIFIVAASNWEELHNIISQNIKRSIWWNHMASFFILDDTPKCTKSFYFLFVVSHCNLLNAKVMCYHKTRETIFNYNPFMNHAPSPWMRTGSFRGLNNYPITVFRQNYQQNKKICVNLDFDKTKDLGGYPIRIQGQSFVSQHKFGKSEYESLTSNLRILNMVHHALKATPQYTERDISDFTNDAKIISTPCSILAGWVTELLTYPHKSIDVVIVSQYRGHKSQLTKILYVIDEYSRYGLGIVYFITLVFFKFFVRQAVIPALLNIVRITCNTGFMHLPEGTAPRIYLTSLLFFAVTMLGIYQGNLASLLTHKIPVRNVETMKDLVDMGYKKIYGIHGSNFTVEHPELKARFIPVDYEYICLMHVKEDPSAVCITVATGPAYDVARQFDLHLSKEPIARTYIGYPIPWDWPLEQRVNIILGKLVEADILNTWDAKCNPTKSADFLFDKQVMANEDFKIIELWELAFAFVILGIGLACATFVFVIEVTTYRLS